MKTIYSLVTKPINQNVGIIRISGERTFEIVSELIPNFTPATNKVEFHKIYFDGQFIDDALVLSFVKPNSFTGEDVIEIQFHGSMFVANKLISILNGFGIEQSEPGEFMKQAYMNGKMDLSQTEAINTLISSDNIELANKSRLNLNGEQSTFVNDSLNELGKIVSNIQVSIDYPENTDLPEYNLDNINNQIKEFKSKVEKILFDSKRLIKYSKGITIALVGMPNAGKSTLLNAFLKEDRAIVSDIAGTTRDVIESSIYLNGLKVTLQDTAGIRSETNDVIEKEGIARSIKTIEEADIVILILDGSKDLNSQREEFREIYSTKLIEVISKSDLIKNDGINISAIDGNIDSLIEAVEKHVEENIYDNDKNNNALLVTQNQLDIFNEILTSLNTATSFIDNNETADVVAFELENAMKLLGKVIGKEIDQDYLTNLFASFCIGK